MKEVFQSAKIRLAKANALLILKKKKLLKKEIDLKKKKAIFLGRTFFHQFFFFDLSILMTIKKMDEGHLDEFKGSSRDKNTLNFSLL